MMQSMVASMKRKKQGVREVLLLIASLVLFLTLFRHWDAIKGFIEGLF